jgi:hypothetical protein
MELQISKGRPQHHSSHALGVAQIVGTHTPRILLVDLQRQDRNIRSRTVDRRRDRTLQQAVGSDQPRPCHVVWSLECPDRLAETRAIPYPQQSW